MTKGSFHAAARRPAARHVGRAQPTPRGAAVVRRVLLWLLCTYACIHLLYNIGGEGPWLPLRDAMGFTAQPPFNHRVLFVLVARNIQMLVPGLHVPACYFLSQILAAAAAFLVIEPWARQFVPERHAVWSQPLLLLLLIPTFTYWTFFDLGIVFFHTAALLALFRRRWWLYVAAFAIGTLNHENTLLLVPVALALRRRAEPAGARVWGWVGAQLLAYAAIRVTLFNLLPAAAAWQSGKIAYNLALVTAHPQAVAKTAVWLLGWGAIVFAGRRRLPPDLVLAGSILLGELVVTTLVVGQLNELRTFDAALPLAVAALLSALSAEAPAAATDEPGTFAPAR